MKTFLFTAMLFTTQLAFAQLNLDVTTSGGPYTCPAQVQLVVEYDIAGNVPPHPSWTSPCINIGTVAGTYTVCPGCTSGEVVFNVQVIDCSNAANNATVGDPTVGSAFPPAAGMPVMCMPGMNNLNFTPAAGATNAVIDLMP